MENIKPIPTKRKFELSMHLVLGSLLGFLIYTFINLYVKKMTHSDNEEISFAATLLFFGGLYIGRFIAQLWIPKNNKAPNALFIVLTLIMAGCCFVGVQFAGSLLSHQNLMYALYLLLPYFIFSVTMGMLVKLVRATVKTQLKDAQVSAANSQGELHILQSQLSPHFLFNTLNNLYGISITQHEKLPQLLLKLSELLRYSVYDTKDTFVLLKDELAYINNYIDFEKIRIGDRLVLTTDFEDVAQAGFKIAPMLLIVFIENAFKHSKNTNEDKIFIDISLKVWGMSILFSVRNSHQNNKLVNDAGGNSNGFGLVNVQQRLHLLYPNQYDLKVTESDANYTVMLRLNIK